MPGGAKKPEPPPDEVLVVARDTDSETKALLQSLDLSSLVLSTVTVKLPGQLAAMNAALSVARGDIIAITDDDAAPHPDCLARIEAHFQADSKLGGVGGRDWLYHGERLEGGARKTVGKVQWFGRVVGNHHLGIGGPKEVDVLKGVIAVCSEVDPVSLLFGMAHLPGSVIFRVSFQRSLHAPRRRRGPISLQSAVI